MTLATPRSPLSIFGIVAVAAAVCALLFAGPAGASEYLIQEEPESGATVAEAPHQILLTFDRDLAQVANAHHVQVTDADGERVDDGNVNISNYSLRTLVVPIHAEGDGMLEVSYDVLLVDGHQNIEVASSYSFSINHDFAPIEGEDLEALADEKSSQALVLWTIAILLGVALVGGLVYFLRMATGNSRSSLEPTNRSVFRD